MFQTRPIPGIAAMRIAVADENSFIVGVGEVVLIGVNTAS